MKESAYAGSDAGVGGLDDAGFDAWLGLWKSQVVVLRELERALRSAGAPSLASCEVLSRLAAAPQGRLRMQQLARRCFVSKSGISQIVTQLSKLDLVQRQGDPDNLRITYAVLTESGRETMRTSAPVFLGAVREHFSRHLDGEDLDHVARIAGKLITAHGETLEGPDDPETDVSNLFGIVAPAQGTGSR
jgi:DNA-binding MarR family transcriptional regulator